MIDCCELALYNAKLVLRVVLGAFGVITFLLAMFFGYNLKWRNQQLELIKRTTKLEKKNGAEQTQINQLKAKIEKLEKTANPNA